MFGLFILLAIPHQIKISKYALYGAGTYPYLSAMIIIVTSIATIISSFSKVGNGRKKGERVNKHGYTRIVLAITGIVFWVIMTPVIGFSVTMFLFILGMLLIMGVRNIIHLILIPLLTTAINYYIFIVFFNIRI